MQHTPPDSSSIITMLTVQVNDYTEINSKVVAVSLPLLYSLEVLIRHSEFTVQ